MKFSLEIELGNAAMQTGDDVAEALRKVAQKLADAYDGTNLPDWESGTIKDANGNAVGIWATEEGE